MRDAHVWRQRRVILRFDHLGPMVRRKLKEEARNGRCKSTGNSVAFRRRGTLRVMMNKASVGALLAVSGFLVIGTDGAQASCAMLPSLQEQITAAPLVFVGTVVSTSDDDRLAHVRVESIWKGPTLSAYVDVHGSPVSGLFNVHSSVDRMYRAGDRDIFVLFSDSSPYQDNSCSATQPYTAEIAAFAPADARPPAPVTPVEQAQNWLIQYGLPVGVALVVIAAMAFIGLRRRRGGSKA
jgi:hypothetical protein